MLHPDLLRLHSGLLALELHIVLGFLAMLTFIIYVVEYCYLFFVFTLKKDLNDV